MKADIFKYNLPEERIAKYPSKIRGGSNLLVLDRESGRVEHMKYYNIVDFIKKDDVVVLNETRVRNTRTFFVTKDSRDVEILFLNEDGNHWFVLIGHGRYVKDNDILISKDDENIKVKVICRKSNGFLIDILDNITPDEIFDRIGHTPLPPYMKRSDEEEDFVRYNTVFGKLPGSSAAPTASLNLTDEMLSKIREKGAKIVKVELKIGWGTFSPIFEENIEDHKIHEEYIHVSEESAKIINEAKLSGHEVWAFGTTVMRTLESACENGKVIPYSGNTDLYIYPGFEFKIVDHLITNFHKSDSSLILLVSAFAGIEKIKEVYDIALRGDYQFLSYGDSMLIL